LDGTSNKFSHGLAKAYVVSFIEVCVAFCFFANSFLLIHLITRLSDSVTFFSVSFLHEFFSSGNLSLCHGERSLWLFYGNPVLYPCSITLPLSIINGILSKKPSVKNTSLLFSHSYQFTLMIQHKR